MNIQTLRNTLTLALTVCLLALSCDDDDGVDIPDPGETTFEVTVQNVSVASPYFQSGVFSIPEGGNADNPLFPGDVYEFSFNAGPNVLPMDGGTRLSFVAMMVQSNDLFFAPDESGIALYKADGSPIGEEGPTDVTNEVLLWDAGTEVNEETGGPSQKPQQEPSAEDVGTDENGVISQITNNTDGINELPDVSEMIKVTIAHTGDTGFTVRIENVSDGMTIMTTDGPAAVPVSPGVYIVHTDEATLFREGDAASDGIENIAEDGLPDLLAEETREATGLNTPLSPGVYAVHEADEFPLYVVGQPDFGDGLEAIAEDGDPSQLASTLENKAGIAESGIFNSPEGSGEAGPIGPGESYSFTITAEPGQLLSIATMFVQSNDWFYGFREEGIPLFDQNLPIDEEVTSRLELFDAGTEEEEYPGAGLTQVIRQDNPDSGPADDNSTLRIVTNAPNNVPSLEKVINVTITPQ